MIQNALTFLANNWATVTMAALPLAEVIVRLTPTKTDDTILTLITKVMDKIVPNNTTKGGSTPQ